MKKYLLGHIIPFNIYNKKFSDSRFTLHRRIFLNCYLQTRYFTEPKGLRCYQLPPIQLPDELVSPPIMTVLEFPPDEEPPEDEPPEEEPDEDEPPEELPPDDVPPEELPPDEVPPDDVPPDEVSPEEVPPEDVSSDDESLEESSE